MEVVGFVAGTKLHQDRWKVRLLKLDGSVDDEYLMNFRAMCKYLVPFKLLLLLHLQRVLRFRVLRFPLQEYSYTQTFLLLISL